MSEIRFDGMFPQHKEWWGRHLDDEPTVILRCGRDGCGDRVGEIKTDGIATLVLRYQKIGEIPVPAPRLIAPTEDELNRLIAERDAKLLRRTNDGYVIPRRREWPAMVSPLEALTFVMCPTHGKLDVPAGTVADLGQFVADTQSGSKRSYSIFRGSPL
jgi:hypothetical protein